MPGLRKRQVRPPSTEWLKPLRQKQPLLQSGATRCFCWHTWTERFDGHIFDSGVTISFLQREICFHTSISPYNQRQGTHSHQWRRVLPHSQKWKGFPCFSNLQATRRSTFCTRDISRHPLMCCNSFIGGCVWRKAATNSFTLFSKEWGGSFFRETTHDTSRASCPALCCFTSAVSSCKITFACVLPPF